MAIYKNGTYRARENNEYAALIAIDDYALVHAEELELHPSTQFIAKNACMNMESLKGAVIPEGVIGIGSCAFANCERLTFVELPSSLSMMSKDAFDGCDNLKTIVVKFDVNEQNREFLNFVPNVENIEVKDAQSVRAIVDNPEFYGKNALLLNLNDTLYGTTLRASVVTSNTFSVPENVDFIGERAVSSNGFVQNVNIGDNVTIIEREAFNGCKNLETVHIGSSLDSVGYGTFGNCPSLREFSVDANNDRYHAVDGNLYDNSNSLVRYAVGKSDEVLQIPSGILHMDEGACAGGVNLKQVVLPDGFRDINAFAFMGCKNLEHINIPDSVTYIDYNAFAHCSSLKEINLPANVDIDDSAFEYCRNLERVTVGDRVIEIHNAEDLENLSQTIRNIQSNVVVNNIEDLLASQTNDIEDLLASETNIYNKNTFLVEENGVLRYTVIHYDDVIIPDEVKAISCSAFSNERFDTGKLKQVYIGDSVEFIECMAFHRCESLENVHIGSNVREIESLAFCMCNSLQSFSVDEQNKYFTVIDGDLYSNTSLIRYAAGKSDSIFVMPSHISSMEEGAFEGASHLTRVVLSDNVKKISECAFNDCPNLSEVVIPNSVKFIGENAFFDCPSLKEITLPENITVDEYAFNGSSLEKVRIGDYVIEINNARDLANLPSTIEYIQNGIDLSQSVIIQSTLPHQYSSIIDEPDLFVKDNRLVMYSGDSTTFTVPNGIQGIESAAFADAKNLQTIIINDEFGDREHTISKRAFEGCEHLEQIVAPERWHGALQQWCPDVEISSLTEYAESKSINDNEITQNQVAQSNKDVSKDDVDKNDDVEFDF